MAASSLQQHYPWLQAPVVINAPMAGMAGVSLATKVQQCGGMGFIGAIFGASASPSLTRKALSDAKESLQLAPNGTVPIGLGILIFVQKIEDVVAGIKECPPAAIWLFAAHSNDDYKVWADALRDAAPDTHIWIQCSSVADAREIARLCGPEVLVMQGSDAGGHGTEPGASIISLVPETIDTLHADGFDQISVVAAGGIADGRSAAAALALGAEGVVMGTAFLAAEEAQLHPMYRDAILETKDGGISTIRAKVFDELPGKNVWPLAYDGRAIVAGSYTDWKAGMDLEQLRSLHKESKAEADQGFGKDKRRAAIWAGTGVGFVRETRPASAIVEQVRDDAKRTLTRVAGRL